MPGKKTPSSPSMVVLGDRCTKANFPIIAIKESGKRRAGVGQAP